MLFCLCRPIYVSGLWLIWGLTFENGLRGKG